MGRPVADGAHAGARTTVRALERRELSLPPDEGRRRALERRYATSFALEDPQEVQGIDEEGRYIIGDFIGERAFDDANQVNTSSSVWRLKFGVSYDF